VLLTKTDLLPHVDFDPALALENARKIHPGIDYIAVSSRTGEGFVQWLGWLNALHQRVQQEAAASVA
jgi:hydrogenase nickel incorporation protein HypB